jgi:hypothetical protein
MSHSCEVIRLRSLQHFFKKKTLVLFENIPKEGNVQNITMVAQNSPNTFSNLKTPKASQTSQI